VVSGKTSPHIWPNLELEPLLLIQGSGSSFVADGESYVAMSCCPGNADLRDNPVFHRKSHKFGIDKSRASLPLVKAEYSTTLSSVRVARGLSEEKRRIGQAQPLLGQYKGLPHE